MSQDVAGFWRNDPFAALALPVRKSPEMTNPDVCQHVFLRSDGLAASRTAIRANGRPPMLVDCPSGTLYKRALLKVARVANKKTASRMPQKGICDTLVSDGIRDGLRLASRLPTLGPATSRSPAFHQAAKRRTRPVDAYDGERPRTPSTVWTGATRQPTLLWPTRQKQFSDDTGNTDAC